MLNALRRAAQSWVAKLLFALLILSFAAWGVDDFLRPSTDTVVAEVGDSEISVMEYSREFGREYDRLRQRFGGQFSRELALQLGLADQVLAQLVGRRLLALEADRLGVQIGDRLVVGEIHSEQAFQNALGQFDRTRFEQVLQANGLSEDAYVARLRAELAREQVAGAINAGIQAPRRTAEALYRHRHEQRTAELLLLPYTAVAETPEPGDAEVAAYYEAHKAEFMAPEYRALTAVLLRPEDVAAAIQVPEERVRAAYESRIREFQTPETRRVTQLLFADEQKAKAAVERLRTGAPFDAVAQEAAAAGAERSEIGTVRRGDLFPAPVENAVFALEKPGVTDPVKSPLGWHVLKVEEIVPGSTKPFEEVKAAIEADLAHEAALDDIYGLANQLDDALAGGATLEEAAQQIGVKPLVIAAVDPSGLDPSGNQVEGLPPAPAFLTTAFATPEGQDSSLAELPQGGYFIVRVDKVTPTQQKPLEAVGTQVAMAWRGEKLREQAKTEAEALAERIRQGESVAAVAEARGLEHRETAPFTRTTNRPADKLPTALVRPLFQAKPGEVVVAQVDDGYVVAKLKDIVPADAGANAEAVAETRAQLTQAMATDLEAQFAEALRQRHGVSVHEATLQRAL